MIVIDLVIDAYVTVYTRRARLAQGLRTHNLTRASATTPSMAGARTPM